MAGGDSVSFLLGESGSIYSCGHKDRNGLGLKGIYILNLKIRLDNCLSP